jgi:predicted RNA-binding Zn ribbon-like protein
MRDAENHRLIGGALCLDFANTLVGHGVVPRCDYLMNYRDLVLWSRHTYLLTPSEAKSLIREAPRHPSKSVATFKKAITLRELIYRIFSAVAQNIHPNQDDLDQLNAARLESLQHSCVVQARQRFSIGWTDPMALDRMLWPIAISATELLTSIEFNHVKQCAGERCDWLFLDNSRNHLRRWCTMDECGNRAKMRRRYERVRDRTFL